MGVLRNPRWEIFAQKLAAGMGQVDAYEATGFKRSEAQASRLRNNPQVIVRVMELQANAAQATVKALSAKANLIRRMYERSAERFESVPIQSVDDVTRVLTAALALEKDERVIDGGVSDRIAADTRVSTVDDTERDIDDILARSAAAVRPQAH